jgi:flagellar biosynthetic protein FlhB
MDQEERTAPPTERRRRQAREQGLGPRSQDLSLACRLVGVALALQFAGSSLATSLSNVVSAGFLQPPEMAISPDVVVDRVFSAVSTVTLNVVLFMSWILGTSLIARLAQVGFRFDVSEVTPDMHRIAPATGLQKLLRFENGASSLINLVKFLLLTGIGCSYVWSHLGQLLALAEEDISDGYRIGGGLLLSLTWLLAGTQLVIGAADYGWQYWKFEQSLWMTAEEVRQEERSGGR